MKALVIKGSARNPGNTEKLCVGTSDGLKSKDVTVTMIRPIELRISHCTHCGGCASTGECVINDDMKQIYDAVTESDIIIFCTPVHFLGVSSILKQVFDRFQCFWEKPPKNKKRVVALVASAGSDSEDFTVIRDVCKAVSSVICAEWKGELIQVGYDDERSPKEEILKAYGFGRSLAENL